MSGPPDPASAGGSPSGSPPGHAGDARIRRANRADLPALLAIQESLDRPNPELLRDALGGVGRVLVSTAGRSGPEVDDAGTDPRRTGHDRRPVGYLLAIPGQSAVHVAELAVAPAHRREGRATALLAALAGRSDADRIRLAVAPDDDAARECYRAAGFSVVRRASDYFDGDPAVIMERLRE